MPSAIARHETKAMQYGSGVMKEIQRLANRKGYSKSVQDYLLRLCRDEGREIG
jgi:asparagine synthase (glutamine-hydrolysing)